MLDSPENIGVRNRLKCVEDCSDTRDGQVDILTATEVIEIGEIGQWKEAMMRVIFKGGGRPTHGLRVHLHGRGGMDVYLAAFRIMNQAGIRVTTEPVFRDYSRHCFTVWVGVSYACGWLLGWGIPIIVNRIVDAYI